MSESMIGWQAGPTERGTLTLVYSCLITMFTCTWSVLHLNVPELDDGPWKVAGRKAKWMAITILFPEFIFAKAICDLRELGNEMVELEKKDPKSFAWTDAYDDYDHTYSWRVDYGPRAKLLYRILGLVEPTIGEEKPVKTILERRSLQAPDKSSYHSRQVWTITHAYFANMGGLLYPAYRSPEWVAAVGSGNYLYYRALSGSILSHRNEWDRGHPLHGLVLGKRDIEDKSKVDWLLRCLTVLQVAWLVLTVLVRGVEGLPVTQLEIATMAFSILAIATYGANWWKPKDVSRPILIRKPSNMIPKEMMHDPARSLTLRLTNLGMTQDDAVQISEQYRVPNDVTQMEEGVPLIFSIMAVSSVVFGGLHLIAWDFEFPSHAELILWRASSLTSTILPLISLGLDLHLNYLVTTYTNNKVASSFLKMLKPLDGFPVDFWNTLKNPIWDSWDDTRKLVTRARSSKCQGARILGRI
ncbi:uncharacterized protein F4822DRAFT_20274 [Hypoxylon trugodes]|uniref:uncharacterized protein n=1 Tax=Hypoxylon trugodes TaxID=326681 RepID=UPI00218E3AD8|nr:uncharacterized protein F4822DRAFT_20274 [Hypoxylon trugodes]KAI1393659.1 hypothetical protein F4822DRAFT_20274 [Hypoxylon trugodes]